MMPGTDTVFSAGRTAEARADQRRNMKNRAGCSAPAAVRQFTEKKSLKKSVILMNCILHIWKTWISVIGRTCTVIATITNRQRR